MAGRNMRLKARRVEFNISQEEMARRLGISQTTYSLKENGYYAFTNWEISKILHILGKTYEDIFVTEEKRDYSDEYVRKTKAYIEDKEE